jgi:prepilin-type N-terminal cleavage/methylation domain-containing protein
MTSERGFTVIELLIAFTILAIVAGSIFQVFYVSARNNELAAEYDAANNLTITAVELFKADPYLADVPMFDAGEGLLDARTWMSADKLRFIKYYNSAWEDLEIPLSSAIDADARPPDGSRYVLEAQLGEIIDADPDSNYLTGAVKLTLDSSESYRLVVNENKTTGTVEIVFNGIPANVGQERVGKIIPINVDFDETGIIPKHIAVINQTERTVNVNVFGVPVNPGASLADGNGASNGNGESNGDGGDGNYSRYITVSPVEGALGVLFFDDWANDNVTRTISVSVKSLSDIGNAVGGRELARVEATKYVPG